MDQHPDFPASAPRVAFPWMRGHWPLPAEMTAPGCADDISRMIYFRALAPRVFLSDWSAADLS